MVKGDIWHEIHSRHKLKESKKSIARALGLDVRTVRKILRQGEPRPYERKKRGSAALVPYLGFIRERLAAVGYCARSIFEELQGRGYDGSYDVVKRFVSPLRKEAYPDATVRFETPPGRQAQVDWGQCWTTTDGKSVKIHLFVFTLGYSRRMYACATRDEKLPAFIRGHVEAFDLFGGVPHEIVYDNLKSVVLARDYDGSRIKWNPIFWDFSRYYGFRPKPHQPYRPQTKGKVESGVKYVKRFLRGKEFARLAHLNEVLSAWIASGADQRVHGTTHRKPAEMFLEERDLLLLHHGKPAYTIQDRAVRIVSRDCLVAFETNRYSVPLSLVGRQVEVQAEDDLVRIFHKGELRVTHDRCPGSYETRIERAHYGGLHKTAERLPEVEVRDLAFYEDLLQGGAL
jgi:transposase